MKRQKEFQNVTFSILILSSITILLCCSDFSLARQTLGDLIREGDFDWLIGRWVSVIDKQNKAELVYSWKIKDNLITADFKVDDFHYHGMIFLSPVERDVVEIGMDSTGGYAKGTWAPYGMDAVSTIVRTDEQGQAEKVDIVHSRIDKNTLRLTLYRFDENNNRSDTPWAVMEYKRQATKTPVTAPTDEKKINSPVKQKPVKQGASPEVKVGL